MTDKHDKRDAPEQTAHGVISIDGTKVGTVLDVGPASITQILYTGAPTSYETPNYDPGTGLPTKGYFTLIEAPTGQSPRVLISFNGHINGGHSPHATHKVSAYSIPFTNLVLQSCPAGATFSITTA
jgi:hypothetical protein